MAATYSNGGNRWNILGFNFSKRDALSSVYKLSMAFTHTATNPVENHLGCRTYPKTLNPGKKVETLYPGKKVETLYPETFESGENSRVNGFP
jgi:hypothetical protein